MLGKLESLQQKLIAAHIFNRIIQKEKYPNVEFTLLKQELEMDLTT